MIFFRTAGTRTSRYVIGAICVAAGLASHGTASIASASEPPLLPARWTAAPGSDVAEIQVADAHAVANAEGATQPGGVPRKGHHRAAQGCGRDSQALRRDRRGHRYRPWRNRCGTTRRPPARDARFRTRAPPPETGLPASAGHDRRSGHEGTPRLRSRARVSRQARSRPRAPRVDGSCRPSCE